SELEGSSRELYTGALGFASPAAGLELSVAIRTFELTRDRVWIGAGGGIVADSRPSAELAEALAKAAPLVAAIGGRLAGEAVAFAEPASPRLPRASELVSAERPDPALGLLETVLVRDGSPVDLEAHLERLAMSARAVYGRSLPPDAAAIAGRSAAEAGDCRLRLQLRFESGELKLRAETAALPPVSSEPVELVPVLLPGGLGAHKWRDRRLVDALAERLAGGVALLVDSDGSVLEAAWGNVWVVIGDEHRTPPRDGRLLPGVARARRLDQLKADGIAVNEQRLALDDLAGAEVYLTSALRGPTPALVRFDAW
ncbi:MAG: aminotransferase class IV, partial [Solirubrobacterales bacterium]|nr:aminotransferase class IV [Solirubrobacterales bacterium]